MPNRRLFFPESNLPGLRFTRLSRRVRPLARLPSLFGAHQPVSSPRSFVLRRYEEPGDRSHRFCERVPAAAVTRHRRPVPEAACQPRRGRRPPGLRPAAGADAARPVAGSRGVSRSLRQPASIARDPGTAVRAAAAPARDARSEMALHILEIKISRDSLALALRRPLPGPVFRRRRERTLHAGRRDRAQTTHTGVLSSRNSQPGQSEVSSQCAQTESPWP